jgi:hypothetical protein
MAAALTLHHGDAQQEYVEHPVTVAKRALEEAAALEWETGSREWAGMFARFADTLPHRPPMLKAGQVGGA